MSRSVDASSTYDARDDVYQYDAFQRLKNVQAGTLVSGSITNRQFEQDWTLDRLGNWAGFKQDDDGNGTWDLEQARVHNKANEIDVDDGIWKSVGVSLT